MTLTYEESNKLHELHLLDSPDEVTRSQYLDFVKPIENWVEADMKRAAEDAGEAEADIAAVADGEMLPPDSEQRSTVTPFRYFLSVAQQGGQDLGMVDAAMKSLGVFVDGDLTGLPLHDDGDDLLAMYDAGVDLFDGELTVCRLLVFHMVMFRNYIESLPKVDQRYQVEYKGETYTLEPESAQYLAESATNRKQPKYPVKVLLEMGEWERIFGEMMRKQGDLDGSIQFRMDMVTMALLLRKPDDVLPISQTERADWLDARMQHFKALPLGVFFQVRFFLMRTFENFAATAVLRAISERGQSFQAPTLRETWAGRRKLKGIRRKLQTSSTTASGVKAN